MEPVRLLSHGQLNFSHFRLFVVSLGSTIHNEITTDIFSWCAIALWSIEGVFQVFINFRRDSCEGQSSPALVLMVLGKSCDIVVQWTLQMPSRYLFLAYFSSANGLLNALQALYMGRHFLVLCFSSLSSFFTFVIV